MFVKRLLLLVVLCLSILPLWAEDERIDTLDEVDFVVESFIAAPRGSSAMNVSGASAADLKKQLRSAMKDLSAAVPNLYIPDYGSRMTSTIYMRGLGSRIDNPVLGVYIDGIGIANKNAFDFDFDGVEAVDVFRGPQGTVFGKNTIGGVMAITTHSAFTNIGTKLRLGYGNGNSLDFSASHYHLANEHVGISASVWGAHTDGFFKNTFDNSKCDYSDYLAARLKIDYRKDNVKLSNSLNYSYLKQGGFPYHQPGGEVNHNDFCGYWRHSLIEGLTYSFALGDYELSGATSYQFLFDRMDMDQDFLPRPVFNMSQSQNEHYVSQELMLRPRKSMSEQGWNWITGLSLSYKHNALSAPVHFLKDGIDSLILANANAGIQTAFPDAEIRMQEDEFLISDEFTQQNVDVALFHTSYYRLKNWVFELGLRLDYEHLRLDYNSNSEVHYLFTETMRDFKSLETSLVGSKPLDYFEVLPRVAISYSEKDWMLFLSASEGYKGGGFNTQLFSDIIRSKMMNNMMSDLGVYFSDAEEMDADEVVTYKPERCANVELGGKGTVWFENGRLMLSGSLFWMEVFNQQLTVFPTKGTGRMMTNAGRSRSLGAEFSANLRWKGLFVAANYGFTDARFVKYDDGHADYKGNRVPFVPQNTLSANISYSFDLKHSFFQQLTLGVGTEAVGTIFWDEANTLKQPFYALLNVNISLSMKHVELQLWAKNLTCTKYDVFYFVSCGNAFMQSGKPLSFGAKLYIDI